MSRPSASEFLLLDQVADEIREVFAERGYRVDVAMDVDPAFGSGWSRAAVTRDLVVDAAIGAASRVGLDFRSVSGGGREFRFLSGNVDRRYRLRRAKRRADGELIISTSSNSALAATDLSLFLVEQWALAWTPSADGLIAEVLAAEVVGFIDGNPGHLDLGRIFALGSDDLPDGEFRPTGESLEGLDDDEDVGDEFGFSAS